jgi:hypothetical protein
MIDTRTHSECDAFPAGTRKWQICRGEAGLPPQKTDAYRESWGLPPLFGPAAPLSETPAAIPELVFHGHSVSEIESGGTRKKLYGPGSELLKIYEAAGVPSCDACRELAQQMNDWGVVECRAKLDQIVADIMPRAKEWVAQKYPWVSRLLPDVVEDFGIARRIRSDVTKAIDECERTISERRRQRLDIITGEKIKGCSSCGGGQPKAAAPRGRKVTRPLAVPLIGQPINRDRLKSHILYHVMPLAGETEWVWRRHCQWLREVRPQYNGRLIIGIVTPGVGDMWQYLPPDAVKEELRGLDAEFIEAPNDTGKGNQRKIERRGAGEGVLYPQMLAKLQTSDPDEIAFYGHCKGVTRKGTTRDSAVHLWADAMHETLFRNHDAAVSALDTSGVCGPFRMRGGYRDGGPGIGSFWFFSGTFFAMRLVDVFRRNWHYLPSHYGCVEQWPRLNFDQNTQAACLFFDAVTNLYDESYWRNTVTPAFNKWKADHGTR